MSRRVSSRIFEAGSLCTPLRGTVRWRDGEALGIWGDTANPAALHVIETDGSVRPANRAERRLARRIWPGLDREDAK